MDTFSAAVMLFLIMDPLGNLPIFSSILRHIEPKKRRRVLIRELLFALIIMVSFLFAGEAILSFLNLRTESVSIAGGIILFLIAIRMIFPQPGGVVGLAAGEEPFIVPMAIPLMAGPSVLAALILLAHTDSSRMLDWTIALLAAWGVSAVILLFYKVFTKVLGEKGLTAVERLMGMVLVMISVQMFLDGIANYMAHMSQPTP
ncbi:YhgN family NAAT transporter [Shewanella sp. D64]|uniref:YhgN family NAAT transporter n=1 Tax=unclassified Shewanella TaxID=196818 RepID=UPI0022BA5048|nr:MULTISPECIES: YhgN family NAAT transporter [unclassified Shewanella]MEC4726282.1 YhgN family NAAT transporter [Shewanella sp. D64]MEC4738294.1 YhgN family NAAT transporter [Shewanella sp. E94]WBJ95430.1 YhgN family NAAT transporter [Shewanella sp. MTB7]